MARDYIENRAAKSVKTAETRGRRTAPEDQGPYTPKQIDRLYRKSEIASNLNVDGGDGLVSKRIHAFEEAARGPQFKGTDGHFPDYLNDVPITRWTRGKDATEKPGYVPTGNPGTARGAKIEASGRDMHKSPFSAAHRKGAGEGF